MLLKRRKSTERIKHPKKQLVTGACHLCTAEFSFCSAFCSFCTLVHDMYEGILRTNKLNHRYSEDKVVYTRTILQVFLSSAWKIISILHLYSFLVYIV